MVRSPPWWPQDLTTEMDKTEKARVKALFALCVLRGGVLPTHQWWLDKGSGWGGFRFESSPQAVVRNFAGGYHEYDEVKELLAQSDSTLVPLRTWDGGAAIRKASSTGSGYSNSSTSGSGSS